MPSVFPFPSGLTPAMSLINLISNPLSSPVIYSRWIIYFFHDGIREDNVPASVTLIEVAPPNGD